MVEYERSPKSEPHDTLRICVVGVGGAGSNVLDRIAIDRTIDATLVSVQTDIRVLSRSSAPRKVQLAADLLHGMNAGGDPDLGREAAMFSREEIRAAVEGHDIIFISTGLGGGTGSGAAPVIAQIAKNTGAIVVAFAAVPFSFEGPRRLQQCRHALDIIEKNTDALILFDNDRMGELTLPKDGIAKAFAQADQLIGQSIRAVSSMVSAPGLVKLGLGDLMAALRVSEGRCVFGFGDAKGANRGSEALKKALRSPLINQGALLKNAKNLLVHIVGGEALTLAEVESVMKQLGRHVPDETQILFGLGIDPKLGDGITVSLVSALSASELASAKQVEQAAPAESREPAPAPAKQVRPGFVKAQQPAPAAAPVESFAPPVIEDLFGGNGHAPEEAASEEPATSVSLSPSPELIRAIEAAVPEPRVVAVPQAAVTRVVEQPKVQPAAFIEPEPAEEMVYHADPEDEPEAAAPTPPTPARPPQRDSARVRLMQFIGAGKAPAPAPAPQQPPVDHVQFEQPESQYAPPPVMAPVPETVPVPLPKAKITTTTVTQVAHHVEASPLGDAFTEAAPAPAPVASKKPAPAPVPAAVEQPTFRFGGEERSARFKDTEPSFSAQGNEDLDTPTWMRMRKRVKS